MDLFDIAVAKKLAGGGGGGGGRDYSTATLSFTGYAASPNVKLYAPCVYEDDGFVYTGIDCSIDDTVDIILGSDGTGIVMVTENIITVSGDITDNGDGTYDVTGDCTITLSDTE